MTTPEPVSARNDTVDTTEATDEDGQDGQLANPGPVPAEAEDSSDTGEGTSGDLAAEARTDRSD